ncbi:MAG TPA: PAS domain S-box protein, partial [Chthoniobacterales bacterium]
MQTLHSSSPAPSSSSVTIEKNHRILIVDDNQAIHADFRKILGMDSAELAFEAEEAEIFGSSQKPEHRIPFEMGFALQGQQALQLVRQAVADDRRYAVVFMDMRMPPGWDGLETTQRLWEADPDLQVVICTAYSDYSWDEMMAKLGLPERLLILKKPFDSIEVLQFAHALTEKWSLLQSARRTTEALERAVLERTDELQTTNAILEGEIVERRLAEEAVRESEAVQRRYAETQISILNALPAHIALIDAEGVILSVNEAWQRPATANFLQGPEFSVGLNYLEACQRSAGGRAAEVSAILDGIDRVLGGETREFAAEYPCHSEAGQRWFRLVATPLHESRLGGAVVMHLNITERKLADEALRKSQASMAVAQKIAHFGSWELDLSDTEDRNGNALLWSDEMYRIAGFQPGEVNVTNALFFSMVPEEEHDLIRDAVSKAIEDREPYSVVHRFIRPEGTECIVRETGEIFFDENTGRPTKMIGTAHDITSQRRAQEAIRMQAHMLNHIGQAVIATDTTGSIVYANRQAGELYGWSPAEMWGKNILDVTVPQTTKVQASEIMEALQRGESWTGEFNVMGRTGVEFPALVTNSPLVDEQGRLTGIVGISTDITQRKNAEKAVQRQAAFAYFNPHPVLELSATGGINYSNDATLKLVRALKKEHPEDILPSSTAEIVADCLETGQPCLRLETHMSDRVISWSFFPIEALQVVHCYAGDITERKRNEERLTEQAALLDKAQDAILVRDLDHKILFWNQSAERLYGWTAHEVLGKSVLDIIYHDVDGFHAAMETVRKTGEWSGHLTHYAKDGRVLDIEGRWTLVCDENGTPRSILAINTDVTEKKKLEAQFLRAQRMEGIGTLAGGIAHDLNNMLAPIMMSLEILKIKFTDEVSVELLDTLQASAQRGADLVKQVLSFARGVEGQRVAVD